MDCYNCYFLIYHVITMVRGDGILCQYADFFSHPSQQKQTELL
jgi:hypothetical protein